MTSCNIRECSPIRTNWDRVDELMTERGIATDAALAELGGTSASTVSRGRRAPKASLALMHALTTAFPDASLDELFSVPTDEQVEAAVKAAA